MPKKGSKKGTCWIRPLVLILCLGDFLETELGALVIRIGRVNAIRMHCPLLRFLGVIILCDYYDF